MLAQRMRQRPRIKYDPHPLQGQEVLRIFLLVVAVAAAFMLHVWMRTLVISEGFKLGEVRSRVLQLEADRVKLRLEREKLVSPDRLNQLVEIYKNAGNVFVSPNPSQILFYEDGESPYTVPGAAR
jgi:hypothetical protein